MLLSILLVVISAATSFLSMYETYECWINQCGYYELLMTIAVQIGLSLVIQLGTMIFHLLPEITRTIYVKKKLFILYAVSAIISMISFGITLYLIFVCEKCHMNILAAITSLTAISSVMFLYAINSLLL